MKLRETIVLTAMYYEKTLNEQVLEMYVNDLAGLNERQVILAYEVYRKDPKNMRFPLPAQIRAICEPPVDDDSLAREAASRIVSAVRTIGYPSPGVAREYIGELGWKVVERNGGWMSLCQNLMEDQIGTFQAQARDLARAQIQFARAGRIDEAPALPSPNTERMSEMILALADRKQINAK